MTCSRRGLRQLTLGSIATGLCLAAMSSDASAQEAVVEPPPAAAAPEAEPPATLPPAAAAPVTEPPPAVTAVEPYPSAAPAAPAEAEAPAEEEKAAPWYEGFSIGGFVDAYAAIRSDKNSRPLGTPIPIGGYYHEAYTQANGFALAVAGLDAVYSGDKVGATISLRLGPAANRFYAADMRPYGLESITQAYVTYKPIEQLTFDLGQFGTIYGAEVLESWKNVNYSRGALYYAMQPFWHTGLRANVKISDAFALNGLLVNGVNNPFENNKSPSLGIQAVVTASDVFSLAVGYLGALNPTQGGNGLFQNFFDLVATVTAGGFKLVANADVNLYKPEAGADGENWWGLSLAPAYAFSDMFGIGARVEYLSDSANLWGMTTTKTAFDPEAEEGADNGTLSSKASLTTITFTVDIKPIPGVAALVLRPEFRYEIAGDYFFFDKDNELTKNFWTVMLGAAVTSL
jgi:hypothetical protein